MTQNPYGPNAPSLAIDPFALEILRDPFPTHAAMREAGPIFRLEPLNCWGVARYKEMRSILENHQVFISSGGVGLADIRKGGAVRTPSLLLETDPPDHSRNRAVVSAILSPKALRDLRSDFEEKAKILVDRLVDKGEFDAVEDLAQAFPLQVFADAVGLPPTGRHMLLAYGDLLFNAVGPFNAVFQKSAQNATEVVAWITHHCSRVHLTDTGFGAQIYAEATQRGLTEQQAGMLVRSFLSAGIDTTVHTISNALFRFARHPDQWTMLRTRPDLMRKAIDEVIRLESPFQTFFRTAGEDVEFGGATIREGDKILLSVGAANRDPRQWDEAEAFRIDRFPSGHVGFGAGIHGCVGQMVARLELEALLGAMIVKVAAIELTAEPIRYVNNVLHGMSHMPIRLVRAN